MADLAGFYGPCNRNYGRFHLSFFYAKLRCEVFAGFVFCHSRRLTLVISTILSFCLGSTQSPNPSNNTIINNHNSTIHSTNRRSTQSMKARKKKEERMAMRYRSVFSFISNDLFEFWCSFCLVTSPTTTTNRTASLEDDNDALQTMHCIMYIDVCNFLCFLSLHTHTNNNTTHTDTVSSVADYDMMTIKLR